MAGLLGLSLSDDMAEDSFDNLPLWKGEDVPVRPSVVHQSIDGSLSLRRGSLKLCMCPGSGGWSWPRPGRDSVEGMPSFQLYDLENDPAEQHNLIDVLPDEAASMRRELLEAVRRGRTTPGASQQNNGAPVWETVRWMEE